MKKLLILCLLIFGCLAATAQSPFHGFFKPLPTDLFHNVSYVKGDLSTTTGLWLFRFDASITAVQLEYNKTDKKWVTSPLSSVGPGLGYRHYVEVNDEPYCDFGVNALVLLGYGWTEISATNLSLVGTVNFLEFINVGAGYNFGNKSPLIIMGAIVNFD